MLEQYLGEEEFRDGHPALPADAQLRQHRDHRPVGRDRGGHRRARAPDHGHVDLPGRLPGGVGVRGRRRASRSEPGPVPLPHRRRRRPPGRVVGAGAAAGSGGDDQRRAPPAARGRSGRARPRRDGRLGPGEHRGQRVLPGALQADAARGARARPRPVDRRSSATAWSTTWAPVLAGTTGGVPRPGGGLSRGDRPLGLAAAPRGCSARRIAAEGEAARLREAWVRALLGPALQRLGDPGGRARPHRAGGLAVRGARPSAPTRSGARAGPRSLHACWADPPAVDPDLFDSGGPGRGRGRRGDLRGFLDRGRQPPPHRTSCATCTPSPTSRTRSWSSAPRPEPHRRGPEPGRPVPPPQGC